MSRPTSTNLLAAEGLWNFTPLPGDRHLSPRLAEARRIDHEIAAGRLHVTMAYRDRHGLLHECARHVNGDEIHLEGEDEHRRVCGWFFNDDRKAENAFRRLITEDWSRVSAREAHRLFHADPYKIPARPQVNLARFAGSVARRLPDTWEVFFDRAFADSVNRHTVMRALWDDGLVEGTLQDVVVSEAALLVGPRDEELVLLGRPGYRAQVLVAALAPPDLDEAVRTGRVPRGIAVPGNPARAAAAITRRLLPRYYAALKPTAHDASADTARLSAATSRTPARTAPGGEQPADDPVPPALPPPAVTSARSASRTH